jgi:hypothetical protein
VKLAVSATLAATIFIVMVVINAANPVLAELTKHSSNSHKNEDPLSFAYPYSSAAADGSIQLAQYKIDSIIEQIKNFHPGQGTTLSYLDMALAHETTLMPGFSQTPFLQTVNSVPPNKVNKPVAINMIYHGLNGNGVNQRILDSAPEFLVNSSPAGPVGGDANVIEYMSAGIKYFEYIDGGYEGTQSRFIPNDLQSNLKYISAVAGAGAYGVFLDEVSSNPNPNSLDYLKQIYDKAHSLGLKVVFNTGVSIWADVLMKYCDYMNSSETWQKEPLTHSQRKFAKRTWIETQEVTNADDAVKLTEAAWGAGLGAHYACYEYITLPDYSKDYAARIRLYSKPNDGFILAIIIALTVFVLLIVVFTLKKRLKR